MRVAVFADEIDRQDPVRALQLAARWEVPAVEVRSLPSGRFPRCPDAELEDFGRRVSDAGLRVSGVSPGLFKCAVDDPSVEAGIGQLLPRACEWARRWDTDQVSVFAFGRGDVAHGSTDFPAAVVDALGRMASVASTHGCRLVLENEGVCWGDTGNAAAALLRQLPSGVRLCWDPGNSARAGSASPVPGEYAGLRDLVAHVHCKNYDAGAGAWSLLPQGVVDWQQQVAALAADGYDGWLIVETHTSEDHGRLEDAGESLSPLEANTLRNLRALRRLLD